MRQRVSELAHTGDIATLSMASLGRQESDRPACCPSSLEVLLSGCTATKGLPSCRPSKAADAAASLGPMSAKRPGEAPPSPTKDLNARRQLLSESSPWFRVPATSTLEFYMQAPAPHAELTDPHSCNGQAQGFRLAQPVARADTGGNCQEQAGTV